MKVKEIKSKRTPPEDERLHKYFEDMLYKTPERYEEAGKVLATIISITASMVIGLGADQLKGLEGRAFVVLVVSVAFFLLSLIFSFLVVFPRRYDFHSMSASEKHDVLQQVIRYKRLLLVNAVVVYLVALVLIFGVLIFWL